MNTAASSPLAPLRELLIDRLRELRLEVAAADQARREADAGAFHEVSDRKDEAAQRQLADLDGAQLRRDLDEMAQVEAALQRLEGGTYGRCTDCGEPIFPQRLRVQPAAPRCASCQAAREQALHASGA